MREGRSLLLALIRDRSSAQELGPKTSSSEEKERVGPSTNLHRMGRPIKINGLSLNYWTNTCPRVDTNNPIIWTVMDQWIKFCQKLKPPPLVFFFLNRPLYRYINIE